MEPNNSSPATPAASPAPTAKPAAKQPTGYISNPLNLVKPSWEAVRLNIWTIVALALITGAVFLALFALFGAIYVATKSVVLTGLVGLVIGLAALVILTPAITIALLESAKGNKVTVGQVLRDCWQYSWRVFIAGILTILAILGGLILLVVPGLIFAAWFSLATLVVIDQNVGPVEAMKRSKALVKGHVFEMLGMFSLPTAVNIISLIPILGGIVSLLFGIAYSAAPGVRYLQLKQLQGSNAAAVPTHWANYAILVVAIISGIVTGNHDRQSNTTQPIPSYDYNIQQ